MAFPAFQLELWLEITGYKGWSSEDKQMAAYGGFIGTGIVVAFCMCGTVIAARGVQAADRTREPNVIAWIGATLCLFAAAVWVMLGVAWYSQAWRFIKNA